MNYKGKDEAPSRVLRNIVFLQAEGGEGGRGQPHQRKRSAPICLYPELTIGTRSLVLSQEFATKIMVSGSL